MPLPENLRDAISAFSNSLPGRDLTLAAAQLSDAYRAAEFSTAPLHRTAHRVAYLQVRMPATYAACRHVFGKTLETLPEFTPQSMLDLGSGPGTAAWAALEAFPSLANRTLVERDLELIRIGKILAAQNHLLTDARWIPADLSTYSPEPHDLIVISYALGELKSAEAMNLVRAAWKAAKVLILIEPGTTKAFARIAELRKQLIAEGATLAAPCPHERECPLHLRGDWCHFSERLERTAEHRRFKGGSLGYEDEKFSYLAATREPMPARRGRIVRHPMIHSGYVQLQVCAPEELQQVTVTRSQKELYRSARKAEWGDQWPPS